MLAMYNGQVGLFASQDILLFFFYVGIGIDSSLFTVMYMGEKRRLYAATKIILYTASGSVFFLIGALTMGFYGSNQLTLDLQSLSSKSYPIELEIILYLGFLLPMLLNFQYFLHILGYRILMGKHIIVHVCF
jgi:NAD(P)H-quinone oxidoreductase subunit 4